MSFLERLQFNEYKRKHTILDISFKKEQIQLLDKNKEKEKIDKLNKDLEDLDKVYRDIITERKTLRDKARGFFNLEN
jgi:hypothetical protein